MALPKPGYLTAAVAAFLMSLGGGAAQAAPGDLLSILDNPAPAVADQFGISVAIAGNLAVVGAHGANGAGTAC